MTGRSVPASIDDPEDLGFSGLPLCREPWESFYILRRGILPCCHGNFAIAPITDWKKAWNSPALKEIRDHLVRGKFSPYCLFSLSCPLVQRHLRQKKEGKGDESVFPPPRSRFLRILNRLLFRIPGKIYRALQDRRMRRKYS